jgi:uncharacterized damage-inducible protein DinB
MTRDTISEIRQQLVEARVATWSLIKDLGEDEAQRRLRPDAWSIKDHVAHLAAVDEAVLAFAQRVLEEERPGADSYDVDAWNARQQARRANRTWQETLAELSTNRERLMSLLDRIPPKALNRTGSHPIWGDPITLSSVLRVPYRHERGHRDEIRVLRNL